MTDPFFVSVECKNGCGYRCRFIKPAAQHNLEAHESLFCSLREGKSRPDFSSQHGRDAQEAGACSPECPWCAEVASGLPILAESGQTGSVRTFETGATRDQDTDKYEYEGFLSPLVLERFAAYMHEHRIQSDGSLRAPDNWQKGIPLDSYIGSGWRHFMDWWMNHRGYEAGADTEEALCALLFNAMGYLHVFLSRGDTNE